jgi:hypothetical protein
MRDPAFQGRELRDSSKRVIRTFGGRVHTDCGTGFVEGLAWTLTLVCEGTDDGCRRNLKAAVDDADVESGDLHEK